MKVMQLILLTCTFFTFGCNSEDAKPPLKLILTHHDGGTEVAYAKLGQSGDARTKLLSTYVRKALSDFKNNRSASIHFQFEEYDGATTWSMASGKFIFNIDKNGRYGIFKLQENDAILPMLYTEGSTDQWTNQEKIDWFVYVLNNYLKHSEELYEKFQE